MARTKSQPTVSERMKAVLADGRPHAISELRSCLYDEMGSASNIHFHLTQIRKRLPAGELIVCVLYRYRICYQHVRTLKA